MHEPALRGFARRLLRPFTRPLDGRIADVNRRVADTQLAVAEASERLQVLSRELGAYAATATESDVYVGVESRRLQEALAALRADIDEHAERTYARIDALEDRNYSERIDRAAETPLERLDGAVANLINRANGHRGFAAQAGLWFNPPVTVALSEGGASLGEVNERIVEIPYALGALARLQLPARVLEIGSAESTFALSVASLGHRVTAIDLHPLPYSHPDINSVVGRFEDWDPGGERFDAVFLISTIEHFGLGAYGEPVSARHADRAAIERVAGLLADGGVMVLTTPYGTAGVDSLERTYDDESLAALLMGWTTLDRHIFVRRDGRTWTPADSDGASAHDEPGVVMIVAVPSDPA